MFFRSNIISAMQKIEYILIINYANSFHQWPVKRFDRYKLTVVNHRGNEQWNIAVIGFKNKPVYMQKQIDGLLKPFKSVKTCVDDVVIFSQILKKHSEYFDQIFDFFNETNIVSKLSDSYIGYLSITFLKQKIDNFGLNTSADKLETFRTIKFPIKLKNLEIYIGMTNYLRNYIFYYT